jgi:predicted CXXCH cytochrome family protein
VTEGPKSFCLLVILVALCLAGSVLAAQENQNKPAPNSNANAAPARSAGKVDPVASTRPSDPSLYAGTESCLSCHEDIGNSHEKSPHSKTELSKNGPAFSGCEGCHGPGKAHAEGGGDTTKIAGFKNLSKAEATKICLDCHRQNGAEHANYMRLQSARNDVGCLDCHSTHRAAVQAGLLKAGHPQLCNGCHHKVKPEFKKPFHDKTNDGRLGDAPKEQR